MAWFFHGKKRQGAALDSSVSGVRQMSADFEFVLSSFVAVTNRSGCMKTIAELHLL
jgi:hypothetical protein